MKCENLDVWKRASKLSADIYIYFKNNSDYGFKDQITRSSLSIASNIAEGIERYSNKETIRFLDIARGSCAELVTQIFIGMKIWVKQINVLNSDIIDVGGLGRCSS